MAQETMFVKHKKCGTTMEIQRIKPEIIAKSSIKCPKCGVKYLFSEYEIVDKPEPCEFGQLKFNPPTLSVIKLKEGRFVIGRKSEGSNAQIQIPINNDNNRTSRDHLVIEVKKLPSGIFHYVELNKERVNETFVNNKPLKYGDKLILRNGDVIRLPDVAITFVLPENPSQKDRNDTVYDSSDGKTQYKTR